MRYRTLDLLRGIAAVIVVFYHFGTRGDYQPPLGFMAVDLFFVISGFALCEGYLRKLRAGRETLVEFTIARWTRLYPVYVVGLVLASVVPILSALKYRSLAPALDFVWNMSTEIVMLPSVTASAESLFASNGPYWSLFFELLASCALAIACRHVSRRSASVTALIALFCLALLAWMHGRPDWGFQRSLLDLAGATARVTFSFSVGVLAWLTRPSAPKPSRAVPALLAVLVVTVLCLAPASTSPLFSIACTALIFPAAIASACRYNATGAVGRLSDFLGGMSYALYAIHVPLLAILRSMVKNGMIPEPPIGMRVLYVAGMVAIAQAIHLWVEPAGRRWLAQLAGRNRAGARPVPLASPIKMGPTG